jgi:DNA-binding CsgD family transcriptional regulator
MRGPIIGRQRELGVAAEFAAGLERGPVGLVFAGEAGIGKTTIWQQAVDAARDSSVTVLSARPAEAEAGLGFAGLADLLGPVVDAVLPGLPGPQRHALAVALLMEEPGPRRLDQRAVCAATLSVLQTLTVAGSVLIAIDDLQWLDGPSARVLEFTARRLGELRVGVLACERIGEGGKAKLDLARAFPSERCIRMTVGPLSPAALHQMLMEKLGRSFPHHSLTRIASTAGGNPFFALELARSLPVGAAARAEVTLPETLRQLVDGRIGMLPRAARDAMVVAAATGSPTVDLITSATTGDRAAVLAALEHAVAAGIITLDDSRICFAHPLFAAGVYSLASPGELRRAHRRLAPLVGDIEERAHHRALGAEQADEGLAGALDAAAEHARRRGAPEVAADLAEYARSLTPPDHTAAYRRRGVQAAEYYFHAGELRQARETLGAVLNEAATGVQRASALRLLGEIHIHEDSFAEALRVLQEALENAEGSRELELAIEIRMAFASVSMGDFAAAAQHGRRALALAGRGADPAAVAGALAVAAIADFLVGRGLDEAKVERSLRLEDPDRQVPSLMRPSLIAGCLALFEGRLERCERLLLPLRERILARGEESDLVGVCIYLVWSRCWRGDLARAQGYAAEAIDSAARIESDSLRCSALAFAALASAYAGEAAFTETMAAESIALASRTGWNVSVLWASWALAVLALSQGNPQAADAALAPLAAMFDDGVPEPARAFFLPDQIEALIGLGRLERAERLLAGFGEAARRLDRTWALMLAARCRALLLAARGDLEAASGEAAEALTRCAGLELGIEVARTFLIAGQIERRRRRKACAAGHLRRAAELFEQMGAGLWSERARAELGRVGLRPPAPSLLTASERGVAELIAAGRTNREAAAQLFMSPKTVEANLARVYRKLGVHSRAELGAKLATMGPTGQP